MPDKRENEEPIREVKEITDKITTFMAGTTYGRIIIYFENGKITDYEELKRTKFDNYLTNGKNML